MDVEDDDVDLRLVKFYCEVLQSLGSSPGEVSSEALGRLQRAYCFWALRGRSSRVDFESEDVRLAYLAKYGPSFAGAVAEAFLLALPSLESLLRTLDNDDALRLSCLGGGSASEAVGIAVALDRTLRLGASSEGERPGRLTVEICVVDIEPRWSETAQMIVGRLQNLLQDPGAVEFEFAFVEQDITEPLGEGCKAALERSHLVTMVKVMSAIYGSRAFVDSRRIVQEIVDCIPHKGVLFLLDSVGFLEYDHIKDLVSASSGMLMKHEKLHSCYNLSLKSVLYRIAQFHRDLCGQRTKNHVHVWEKKALDDSILFTTSRSSDDEY